MRDGVGRSARHRLLATSVLGGVLAIAAPALTITAGWLAASGAQAQDYTSGTFVGKVTDSAGAPVAGAAVVLRSQAQGFTRTMTTGASGEFRAPLIPGGRYSISINKEGYNALAQTDLDVAVGGDSTYAFQLDAVGAAAQTVVVTAHKATQQLDFSRATTGLNVDVQQLATEVPVARNLAAVALLSPGVSLAVNGFHNTAGESIPVVNGASAGENAYYVNGLNITNFDTYIGGAVVPFDFYKSIEIKTGGVPAEFGRATGGVINATTKSGTNDLYFAVHGNYAPEFARSTSPDTYLAANHLYKEDQYQTSVEMGGPLLRDHLFFYGLYQTNYDDVRDPSTVNTITNKTYVDQRTADPFYGYKLDAFITSKQHLEFTDFNTSQTFTRRTYGYDPTTGAIGAETPGASYKSGGNNYVAKYTGTFTDWFTVSAAYGVNHDENYTLPADPLSAYATDERNSSTATRISTQNTSGLSIDNTKREFYRADFDLYFEMFGKHHIRGGFDHENTDLFHEQTLSGGYSYLYNNVRSSQSSIIASGLPAGQEYVRVLVETFGGADVKGQNQAYYLEDSWNLGHGLNLELGVRDDEFTLDNLSGEKVINLKNNWAPRVALNYDPFHQGKDKITVSFNRFYVPPASNLSFRGRDLYYYAYFLPPSGTSFSPYIGANGVPTALGTQITAANYPAFAAATSADSACPSGGVATAGALGCVVYGSGEQEPAASKTSLDLQATYEDEFQIGYEKQINRLWKAYANFTVTNLGTTSEDVAIDSAVLKYCARNAAVAGCSDPNLANVFYGDADYVVLNPGRTTTVRVRTDLDTALAGKVITLTKDDLGNPKPSRHYYGLTLGFSRAFDGKWSLAGSYTLSQLKGNYEGTVKSDAGNSAQTDAGSTEDFDHPGLEEFADGLLPNHHAHEIKLYGNYMVLPGLNVGLNLDVMSPRHYGCIGYYPSTDSAEFANTLTKDPYGNEYGAASRYCYNTATGQTEAVPRGTAFVGDWFEQVDLKVAYTVPRFAPWMRDGLTLRVDVFNLFNSQQVVQYDEVGDSDDHVHSETYKLPIYYQTPRFVRFGFDWVF